MTITYDKAARNLLSKFAIRLLLLVLTSQGLNTLEDSAIIVDRRERGSWRVSAIDFGISLQRVLTWEAAGDWGLISTREGSPTYLRFWPADLVFLINVPFQ
jgi:hypothetical protein